MMMILLLLLLLLLLCVVNVFCSLPLPQHDIRGDAALAGHVVYRVQRVLVRSGGRTRTRQPGQILQRTRVILKHP